MSTKNIYFHGEISRISTRFGQNKSTLSEAICYIHVFYSMAYFGLE